MRVYGLAANLLEQCDERGGRGGGGAVRASDERRPHAGDWRELWAFGSALKLVLIERLCANLDSERVVSLMVGGLRALERVAWPEFVESVSIVERILERDPAGIYARMDFATRDRYRHQVDGIAPALEACLSSEVAEKVIAMAADSRRR